MERVIQKNFTDLNDFLNFVDKKNSPWRGELASRTKGNKDWYGTDSWEETMSLARYGWPEGRKKLIKAMSIFVQEQRYSINPFSSLDVCGAYPNIPMYVAGDPAHMFNHIKENKGQVKIIDIIVYVTSSASVSGQSKINWGAALVSLVDNLETLGYSVNIKWVSASKPSNGCDGPDVIVTYDLKLAGNYIDFDKLTFWLINPSTQRRINFSFKERLNIEKWYHNGYGKPFNTEELTKFFDENFIILDGSEGSTSTQGGYELIKRDIDNHFKKLNLVSPITELQENEYKKLVL